MNNNPAVAGSASSSSNDSKPLHVVFIHLDLGIGGAEQLVLQLATASQDLGYHVDIVTTRCDQDHCFDIVQQETGGRLSSNVYVYGRWIPPNILGGIATAFMSTIRMLYLTYKVACSTNSIHRTANVVVVDVLPTSLPLLLHWMSNTGILFYCHYPDKLLLRDSVPAPPTSTSTTTSTPSPVPTRIFQIAKGLYRQLLDALEEQTMALADTLVVNSRFTLGQVEKHFPSLCPATGASNNSNNNNTSSPPIRRRYPIEVLYPALDTSTMVQANNESKNGLTSPIVSLNRFERKKNIGLLLEAYAYLKQKHGKDKDNATLPPLIIAGGYDTKNVENVEYRGELGMLAQKLGIPEYKRRDNNNNNNKVATAATALPPPPGGHVEFRLDISDVERATLFQTSLCVVYTPHNEHFGIVPLEAMFAGTPVLAVNSGGPTETVIDDNDDDGNGLNSSNSTGFLREPTPEAFGDALWQWIERPELATEMGRRGRQHVEQTFGTKRFENEWQVLIDKTKQRSILRNNGSTPHGRSQQPFVLWANAVLYILEAILALLAVLLVTYMLRQAGLIETHQSILGAVRKQLQGDEL
jgi:alpha-1,3/alpha-1,6-mannosyltransferase